MGNKLLRRRLRGTDNGTIVAAAHRLKDAATCRVATVLTGQHTPRSAVNLKSTGNAEKTHTVSSMTNIYWWITWPITLGQRAD